MDYFFATICPAIGVGVLVIMVVFSAINHLNKTKLITLVLQSEEKRQNYIRMDSTLISTYKKIFWLILASWTLLAVASYYFLPDLFNILKNLLVEMILFLIIMIDDYFYRKAFLKAIEK